MCYKDGLVGSAFRVNTYAKPRGEGYSYPGLAATLISFWHESFGHWQQRADRFGGGGTL
jgi:hypothetical protein